MNWWNLKNLSPVLHTNWSAHHFICGSCHQNYAKTDRLLVSDNCHQNQAEIWVTFASILHSISHRNQQKHLVCILQKWKCRNGAGKVENNQQKKQQNEKEEKNWRKKINLKKFKTVKMQERCGGGWKQPTRRSRLNILRLQSFSPNAIFLGQIWYEQSGKYGERASKKLTMLQDKKSGGAVRLWHRSTLVARERERGKATGTCCRTCCNPGKERGKNSPFKKALGQSLFDASNLISQNTAYIN